MAQRGEIAFHMLPVQYVRACTPFLLLKDEARRLLFGVRSESDPGSPSIRGVGSS